MTSSLALSAAAAIGAAVSYALASVLQHRGARAERPTRAGDPRLLIRLLSRPVWLAGTAADGIGFLLQTLALMLGPLVLVQPLIGLGLILAVGLDAVLDHRGLEPARLAATTVAATGLVAFLILAEPEPGRGLPNTAALLTAVGPCAAVAGMLVWRAGRRNTTMRSVLLGLGVGVAYGVSAALLKASANQVTHGLGQLLTSWYPYALVIAAALGMLMNQSVFQSRPLQPALVALTVADPVTASILGWAAFGESVRTGTLRTPLTALAVVTIAAGLAATARLAPVNDHDSSSPALRSNEERLR